MAEPSHPKNAASVILLRPKPLEGFEIFLTQRPLQMKFLGGMYVFPGGTVRKEDCADAVLRRCLGLTPREAQRIAGATLSPQLCLGHWVAAVRELFEEVGVLLCVTETGEGLNGKEQKRKESVAEKRLALIKGEIDFRRFLEGERLLCDLARLAHFSHWQTPREFAMRFSTHFYLAQLPPDQEPLPNSQEVTDGLWVTPEHALKLCEQGSLPLIFPTFACLRTLADFSTLKHLGAEYGLG
jgi:8-oxo-dGTP pyrophosphatase MutT (NUDIX family)